VSSESKLRPSNSMASAGSSAHSGPQRAAPQDCTDTTVAQDVNGAQDALGRVRKRYEPG
jgi:hypothetical protein